MSQITQWRRFDLRKRYARIRRAFDIAEVTSPDDVPIIVSGDKHLSNFRS